MQQEESRLTHKYIDVHEGNVPIVITAPHGGTAVIDDCPLRRSGVLEGDINTHFLAESLLEALKRYSATACGKTIEKMETDEDKVKFVPFKPYCVIAKAHRKYCDLNRPINIALENKNAEKYYHAYHTTIKSFVEIASKENRNAILIDIHGQGSNKDAIFRGSNNGKTLYCLSETCGESALFGENSVLGKLEALNYTIIPSCRCGFTELENAMYNGGYTVQFYSKQGIACLQLEIGYNHRKSDNYYKKAASHIAEAIVAYYWAFIKSDKPCYCDLTTL